jgi:hypothetical protein
MFSSNERKRNTNKRMNRNMMFDEFDPNMDREQIKALKKFYNNEKIDFYEYIWVCDREDLSSKDKEFQFNYYEEVGKALQKYGESHELNIMEQILVMMSGNDEVKTKYSDMNNHPKYQHFWNTIDKWINITDNGYQ